MMCFHQKHTQIYKAGPRDKMIVYSATFGIQSQIDQVSHFIPCLQKNSHSLWSFEDKELIFDMGYQNSLDGIS